MRLLIHLTLLFTLGAAGAQASDAFVVALPTPDGAQLRWSLPNDTLPTRGFIIRVTDGPLTRTVRSDAPLPFAPALGLTRQQYDQLISIYRQPATDVDDRNIRAIMELSVAAEPRYARALGILTTLRNLGPGQHTATVYAVGSGGETRVGSVTFTTRTTPPVPVPTAIQVNAVNAAARLTWKALPSTTENPVVAYNVYRAAATGDFKKLEPSPYFPNEGRPDYEDASIKPNTPYRYRVTAVDLFGRESAPSTPVAFTLTTREPLAPPEIQQATGSNKKVQLSWNRITDPRARSVLLLRGTTPETLKVIATLPVTATRYTDTAVTGGIPYVYSLALEDAGGKAGPRGPLSSAVALNLTPPATPRGLTVKAGEDRLTLTWNANPEPDLRGYLIYRFEGNQPASQAVLLTGTPVKATTYVDAIPQGVLNRYHYQVVATNTSRVESGRSAPASGTLVDVTGPPAPVLTATAEGTAVQLSWGQSQISDLAGFELWRGQGAEEPTRLAQLAAMARQYSDTRVTPGASYTYILLSVDTAGNYSAPSAPEQVRVTATGPAVAPSGVRATLLQEAQGVKLTWVPAGTGRVVIYRVISGQPVQISDLLTGTEFVDIQGSAGDAYRLRTVSETGELSPLSEPVKP